MSMKPAFGIFDPALQRDDSSAARDDMAQHTHFGGIGENGADKLGGGFM